MLSNCSIATSTASNVCLVVSGILQFNICGVICFNNNLDTNYVTFHFLYIAVDTHKLNHLMKFFLTQALPLFHVSLLKEGRNSSGGSRKSLVWLLNKRKVSMDAYYQNYKRSKIYMKIERSSKAMFYIFRMRTV